MIKSAGDDSGDNNSDDKYEAEEDEETVEIEAVEPLNNETATTRLGRLHT